MAQENLDSVLTRRIILSRAQQRFCRCDSGETRITQSILGHPFQKLDSSYDEWIEPAAREHLSPGSSPISCTIPGKRLVNLSDCMTTVAHSDSWPNFGY